MPTAGADREAYFPLIEKKHGEKMSYWFARMKDVEGAKYPEQIAFLKENYGFSQAHANALVMYTRGSTSARRFESFADFLAKEDAVKVKTIKKIFKSIQSEYPELELVIAWNQPMLRYEGQYIFGLSTATNHILMAPWSKDVLANFADRLEPYDVKKKTIGVPANWKVNVELVQDIAGARLKEVRKALKAKKKA
jgi:uncharacterized protein YdhG (YjbR/CyaY superfamily)